MNEKKTVNICVPIEVNFTELELKEIVKKFLTKEGHLSIPKGEWKHEFDDYDILTCSECGTHLKQEMFCETLKYCPYCGCEME